MKPLTRPIPPDDEDAPMTAHHTRPDQAATDFAPRHIGLSPGDVDAMLESVGAKSLAALISETLPASIRRPRPLDLGAPLSETEALAHMSGLATGTRGCPPLVG